MVDYSRRIDYPTNQMERARLKKTSGDGPGVYIAYRNDVVLYVGQASKLSSRLHSHSLNWLSFAPEMFPTHFMIIDVPGNDFMRPIEGFLIREMSPALNRRHETSGRSYYGCVQQVGTALFDGWYFSRDLAEMVLSFWSETFSCEHELRIPGEAPLIIPDDHSLSGLYRRCLHNNVKGIDCNPRDDGRIDVTWDGKPAGILCHHERVKHHLDGSKKCRDCFEWVTV